MFAVSSLRSLMFKLLGRAELAHFRHQEDALRPFVAVLRQCDDLGVRGSAVQCVAQVRNSLAFLLSDQHGQFMSIGMLCMLRLTGLALLVCLCNLEANYPHHWNTGMCVKHIANG